MKFYNRVKSLKQISRIHLDFSEKTSLKKTFRASKESFFIVFTHGRL